MEIKIELKGIKRGQKTCGKCKHRERNAHDYLSCSIFKKDIGNCGEGKSVTERLPECIAAEIEEKVLCARFDIEIGEGDYPCSSCACNPKGENWDEECTGCGFCHHESCPATGCIDYNEGICEHKGNMGNECYLNDNLSGIKCPKEKAQK
jgi:hypothetical protein